METIVIGIIGGAAYSLQGIFKNKYELSNEFRLDPLKCISSVIIGAIIGGAIGATGVPEPQVVALIGALGVNKGVKAGLKLIVEWIMEAFN